MSVVALVKNTIAPSRPAQPEAKMARADASSFASIRLAQEELLLGLGVPARLLPHRDGARVARVQDLDVEPVPVT